MALQTPIEIGLLTDARGVLARTSEPFRSAAHLAVDDINAQGGLLGRLVRIREIDSSLPPQKVAAVAADFVRRRESPACFLACRSNIRRALAKRLAGSDCMLWYPLHHEGFEQSHNVLFTGPTAMQQIGLARDWLQSQRIQRVHLVGSDTGYSHTFHRIFEALASTFDLEITGECYLPLNANPTTDRLQVSPRAEAILNTITGIPGHRLLADFLDESHHWSHSRPPVLATGIIGSDALEHPDAFRDFLALGERFSDHYSDAAQRFTARVAARQPHTRMETSSAGANIYDSIGVWAKAVSQAGSLVPDDWLPHAYGEHPVLLGSWFIEDNLHVRRRMDLGCVTAHGSIETVQRGVEMLDPDPWLNSSVNADNAGKVQQKLLIKLSDEINNAREAEHVERERTREVQNLAFMASHTLREPLQSLMTMTAELEKADTLQQGDHLAQMLGYIRQSASKMNDLVVTMMTLSNASIASSQDQPRRIHDLNSLLAETFQAFAEGPVQCHIEPLGCVEADGRLLKMLVDALLRWRKSSFLTGDKVLLSIRAVNAASVVRLYLEDDGPPASERSMAFINQWQGEDLTLASDLEMLHVMTIVRLIASTTTSAQVQNRLTGGVRICLDLDAATGLQKSRVETDLSCHVGNTRV